MASEYHTDQQAAEECKNSKDSPSPSQPSAHSGPTLLNEGPESVRSSDC
jgi:hypothetical protein